MIEQNGTNKQKKVKFSYSRVNQYDNCPFAYKLKYEEGLYIDPPSIAALFGTALHKVNELISQSIMAGEEIPYENLKRDFYKWNLPKRNKYDRDGDLFGMDYLAKHFPKEWIDFSSKSGKSYATKAREFVTEGIYRQEVYLSENPNLELVGAEVGFSLEYKGYNFVGYIDRLLKDKNDPKHFVLHDIKTRDHPFDKKDLPTPLQFVIYVMALRQMYGEDITVECYYDLPIIDLYQQGGTKGFEKRGMKKLDKLLDGISAKDWTPHPTPLCYWCPYSNTNPHQPLQGRNLCPYYSLWRPDASSFDVKFEWRGAEEHPLIMQKFLRRMQEEHGDDKPRKFNFDF